MQRRQFITLLAATPLAACINPAQNYLSLRGQTMGTGYSVKFSAPLDGTPDTELKREIDQLLATVNRSMSHYDPDSELSRFNRSTLSADFAVSDDLHRVVSDALRISVLSQGAFDVTVAPLVNAWGFGPQLHRYQAAPPVGLIETTLQQVGYRQLSSRADAAMIGKSHPGLSIDLSGIGKGHGVDRVAELLDAKGVSDYLVEIGGEIRVKGVNHDAQPWRVAIEEPLPGQRSVRKILRLDTAINSHRAVATSGNYRQFFDYQGQRYSHMIDPTTGWPVQHQLASVTVIAPTTLEADAWATALQVLGPQQGLQMAEREGLAAFFISAADDGFKEQASSAFQPFLEA